MTEKLKEDEITFKDAADGLLKLFSEAMGLIKVLIDGYWKGITLLGGANGLALAGVLSSYKDLKANGLLLEATHLAAVSFSWGLALAIISYAASLVGAMAFLREFASTINPELNNMRLPGVNALFIAIEFGALVGSGGCLIFGVYTVVAAMKSAA